MRQILDYAESLSSAPGGSGNGLPSNVLSKTSAFTAASGDFIEADATSAGFTVTLPTAPATGALVAVKKIDGTSNTVTIAPGGGGTIDGQANATTATQMAGAIFEHVGSNVWRIVASMSTTGPAGTNGTNGTNAALSTIEDEGVAVTQRATMNFTGAGVQVSDAGGKSVVTIGGGAGGGGGLLPRALPATRYITMPGVLATRLLDSGYEMCFPFEVFASTTFTQIGLEVTALDSAAVIRLGVRQDDVGRPGTLVAAGAATIDASSGTGSTGFKEVGFAQTLTAGIYWLTARSTGGQPVVRATNSLPVLIASTTQAGAMGNSCSGYDNGGGGSGALPASWGSTYSQAVTVPRITLKTA